MASVERDHEEETALVGSRRGRMYELVYGSSSSAGDAEEENNRMTASTQFIDVRERGQGAIRSHTDFEGDDCSSGEQSSSEDDIQFKYLKNLKELVKVDVDSIICVCERLSDFERSDKMNVNLERNVLKVCTNNKILQEVRSKYPHFENQRDVMEFQLQVGATYDNIYVLIRNLETIAEINYQRENTKVGRFFNVLRKAFARLGENTKTRRLNVPLGNRFTLYGEDWDEFSRLLDDEFERDWPRPYDGTPPVIYYKCQHGLKSQTIHRSLNRLKESTAWNKKPLFSQVHVGLTFKIMGQVVLCDFQHLMDLLAISNVSQFRGRMYKKFYLKRFGHFSGIRNVPCWLSRHVSCIQMYDEEAHKLKAVTQVHPMNMISRLFCGDCELWSNGAFTKPPVFGSGDISAVQTAIDDYLVFAKTNGLTGRIEFVFVDIVEYGQLFEEIDRILRLLEENRVLVVSTGDRWSRWIDMFGITKNQIIMDNYVRGYFLKSPRPFTLDCRHVSWIFHIFNSLIRFLEGNYDRHEAVLYKQFMADRRNFPVLSCDQFQYIIGKHTLIGHQQPNYVNNIRELYTVVSMLPDIKSVSDIRMFSSESSQFQIATFTSKMDRLTKEALYRLIIVYSFFAKVYCGLKGSMAVEREMNVFRSIHAVRDAYASSPVSFAAGSVDVSTLAMILLSPLTLCGSLLSSFALDIRTAKDDRFIKYLKDFIRDNVQCFPAQFVFPTMRYRRKVWVNVYTGKSAAIVAGPRYSVQARFANLKQYARRASSTTTTPIIPPTTAAAATSTDGGGGSGRIGINGPLQRTENVAVAVLKHYEDDRIFKYYLERGSAAEQRDRSQLSPPPSPSRKRPSVCNIPASLLKRKKQSRCSIAAIEEGQRAASASSESTIENDKKKQVQVDEKTKQRCETQVTTAFRSSNPSCSSSFASTSSSPPLPPASSKNTSEKAKKKQIHDDEKAKKQSCETQVTTAFHSSPPSCLNSSASPPPSPLSVSSPVIDGAIGSADVDRAISDNTRRNSQSPPSPFVQQSTATLAEQQDIYDVLESKLKEIENERISRADIPKSGPFTQIQLKFILLILVLRCRGMSKKRAMETLIRLGGRTFLPGRTVHGMKSAIAYFRKNKKWVEHQLMGNAKVVGMLYKRFF